jgi:inward rectifier potassium channel
MTIPPIQNDLGFGSVVAREARIRLLNRDGSFNAVRAGQSLSARLSPYQSLLTMRWPAFLGVFVGFYLLINVLFALVFYSLGPDALSPPAGVIAEGRFWTALFFSVETFGTIGYGNIVPNGLIPNVLVVLESIVSILMIALATGLIFSRFARPVPRVKFSERALIAPYRGMTAFMFRLANERRSELVNVQVSVIFSRFETIDGARSRTFAELDLERESVMFFSLSWTVVHPITESSPMRGLTHQELLDSDAEFLIMLTATDEVFAQQVHTRSSYIADEVLWGAKFTNIFIKPDPDGRVRIDMRLLDRCERAPIPDTIPILQPPQSVS